MPNNTKTKPEMDPNKWNKTDQNEYINQQGTFWNWTTTTADEIILQVQTQNKQQNFVNTLGFIAKETRRDQMINDNILMQYSLRVRLKKIFWEYDQKATTSERNSLQYNLISNLTSQSWKTYGLTVSTELQHTLKGHHY